MKTMIFSFVAITSAMILVSCTPKLAEQSIDPADAAWIEYVGKTYPNWERPENPPPYTPVPSNKLVGMYPHEQGVLRPEGFDGVPSEPISAEIVAFDQTTPVTTPISNMDIITPVTPITTPIVAEVIVPAIPATQNMYVVKPGDSFWKISVKVYGNGKYSDQIVKANSQVKNKNVLRPGTKLILPNIPGINAKASETVVEKPATVTATPVIPVTKLTPAMEVKTDSSVKAVVLPVVVDSVKR